MLLSTLGGGSLKNAPRRGASARPRAPAACWRDDVALNAGRGGLKNARGVARPPVRVPLLQAGGTMLLSTMGGGGLKNVSRGGASARPRGIAGCWLPAAYRLLPVPSWRLPLASRCFSWLPVASGGVPCAFLLVITANLSVAPQYRWSRRSMPLVSPRVFC